MKVRHLFVFATVLALAILGTSCDKDKAVAKKMTGKWTLSNLSYRDSDHEDWTDSITVDANMSIELSSDGTYTTYISGVADRTGQWEYHGGMLYLRNETTNISCTVEECTKTYMEWFARSEKWHESELAYWREEMWEWKK
ncbi:MAG: hypothetical protein J6X51_06685 [Bacteroidales bacterium]|nr:hypothetical protein [Bacteroidales bacterium]